MTEQKQELIFRIGRFDQEYKWSAGEVGSKFFIALRDEGKILGSKTKSGRVLVPPRSFDEDRFEPTEGLVEVGPEGEIVTFSVSYLNPDASPRDEPWAVGIIKLDGADTGMMHTIQGVANPAKDLQIGMRVKAIFKAPEDRRGEILDISHFEPV
ncbi:MAG: Zn-ribbon domain-containing OB-fold protein [Candidatus Lernaella stagnicola]|nr:Zn-ribbon domain-containing OB-fold protein [Candidatus Lernaella stagnicola]